MNFPTIQMTAERDARDLLIALRANPHSLTGRAFISGFADARRNLVARSDLDNAALQRVVQGRVISMRSASDPVNLARIMGAAVAYNEAEMATRDWDLWEAQQRAAADDDEDKPKFGSAAWNAKYGVKPFKKKGESDSADEDEDDEDDDKRADDGPDMSAPHKFQGGDLMKCEGCGHTINAQVHKPSWPASRK